MSFSTQLYMEANVISSFSVMQLHSVLSEAVPQFRVCLHPRVCLPLENVMFFWGAGAIHVKGRVVDRSLAVGGVACN